ncbi:MAG: hypothetical protein RLZZ282_1279, partial [Verrucomicrobiota bacterium]
AGGPPLRVSALHPLLADLARQVGGARVEVFDLVSEGGNLHRFEPQPAEMKTMGESAIVLASGKNFERYLDRLRSAVPGCVLIEVGRTLPSLAMSGESHGAHCSDAHGVDDAHGAGAIDPHWWHSVDNMRRAARVVAQAFGEKDPEGKAFFLANASDYGQRLDALKRWANRELGRVPREQRKLVTAHNAFGYFCKEFGFEVIAVAGLNQEQNTTPREQAQTIEAVKKSGVRAVFPETHTSGKGLDAIATATGARLGAALIADGNERGTQAGFEAMIRHNVTAITQALTAP